jgi:hypothetical protein
LRGMSFKLSKHFSYLFEGARADPKKATE